MNQALYAHMNNKRKMKKKKKTHKRHANHLRKVHENLRHNQQDAMLLAEFTDDKNCVYSQLAVWQVIWSYANGRQDFSWLKMEWKVIK
jgi:DNA-binding transcriptional regulator GbsR (MarR family)